MASILTQNISLEGAEQIKQQVQELGQGVEGTFAKIKQAVDSLGQGEGVQQATNQLFTFGEKAAIAAADQIKSQFEAALYDEKTKTWALIETPAGWQASARL